jgi:hypothetical protein
VSVRNLLPLWIASLLSFFLGLVQAMERMPYHATLHLGEIGLLVVVGVGLAMALGVKAPVWERLFVAFLRACLSGGLFVFIFEGMRLFAKMGDVPLAVASWAFACILALVLARLTPAGEGRLT